MIFRICLFTFCAVVANVALPQDAPTGDLKIKFVFKGDVPKPKPVKAANCGKGNLVDESLVVNLENKGIANIFVYAYTGRGGAKFPVKLSDKTHTLANKDCRFEPHALLMRAGDKLKVTNPDPVGHNVSLSFFVNKAINVVVPPGGFTLIDGITKREPVASPVACNIHPWMKAQILVVDHPFAALSDKNGELTIKNLPVGKKMVFRASHELGTFKNEIYVNGKKDKWKRNNFEVKIKKGMNDLGTVEVPAANF